MSDPLKSLEVGLGNLSINSSPKQDVSETNWSKTGNLTPFAGSPQPILSSVPNVQMPPLPTISLPPLPTVNLPPLPAVNFPPIGTISFPIESYLLQDNQTAEMIWNYPNPPRPKSSQSSYRRVGCIGDGSCLFHAVLKGIAPTYLFSYKIPKEISEDMLSLLERTTQGRVYFDDFIFDRTRNRNDLSIQYRVRVREKYSSKMDEFRHEFASSLRGDLALKIQNGEMKNIILRALNGPIHLRAQELALEMFPDLEQRMIREENGLLIEQTVSGHPEIIQEALRRTEADLIQELLSGEAVQPDFLVILSEYTNFDFYLLRDTDLIHGNLKNVPLYGGQQLHEPILGPQDLRPENDPRKSLPNRAAIVIISFNDNHYELVGRVDTNPEGKKEFNVRFDQTEPLVRTLYIMLRTLRTR